MNRRSVTRRPLRLLAAGTLLLLSLAVPTSRAQTAVYRLSATGPARFQLPDAGTGKPRVVARGGAGTWLPITAERKDGAIAFAIDPATLGGGDILLMIDPPANVDLDDDEAPATVRLVVDGEALPLQPLTELGIRAPRRVQVGFREQRNRINSDAVAVSLNGNALPRDEWTMTVVTPKEIELSLPLAGAPLGRHTVTFTVPDTAPLRNTATASLTFEKVDESNLMRSQKGVTLAVDSRFAGYPSLDALTDGVTDTAQVGAGNAGSWASAETEEPHWVEIGFPKACTVREVTLYWPRSELASRAFEVQVPDGDTWRTVAKTDPETYEQTTRNVLTFAPRSVQRLRLYQLANGGCPSRPGIFWIAEIEVR